MQPNEGESLERGPTLKKIAHIEQGENNFILAYDDEREALKQIGVWLTTPPVVLTRQAAEYLADMIRTDNVHMIAIDEGIDVRHAIKDLCLHELQTDFDTGEDLESY